MTDLVRELSDIWKQSGYTEEHVFPGEYVLLVDPETLLRVRIYDDGGVWWQNENGEYMKPKGDHSERVLLSRRALWTCQHSKVC